MSEANKLSTEERLTHIVNCAFKSLAGQLIVDKDGIILYWSDDHEKYIGIKREDAIGRHCTEMVPNTRMHIIAETGKPECGMIYYYEHHETGEITPSICNRIPIIEDGEVIGVMSETIFTRGFNDVNVLAENIKNIDFNPTTYRDTMDLKEGVLEKICGTSPSMDSLKNSLLKFADLNLPVLITGETGTGKEVFANTLKQLSYRRMKPFVKINCAAIPGPLLESELFGYEPGAFSGALKNGKMGKLEYAGDGTILLDEIGDMPLDLQSKLLRVLQEKEFEKVGGLETIPFNARIICTTNCDLEKLVEEGKFRSDLYYRINVLEMKIPPLRERVQDIPALANFFIKEMNFEEGTGIDGIDDEMMAILQSYSWPGNARELRHVIQRACVLTGTGILTRDDFDFFIRKTKKAKPDVQHDEDFDVELTLESAKSKAEIKAIRSALIKTGYNKSKAAEILDIDRTVLYTKMKKYEIE